MFLEKPLDRATLMEIPIRSLAHLGDAVCKLFETERWILSGSTAKTAHTRVTSRINNVAQAQFLHQIEAELTEAELDIVRRARNLKSAGYRKIDRGLYRRATAFEALVGYLYLSDRERLELILERTLTECQNDQQMG